MRVDKISNTKSLNFKAVMAAEGTTEELMELHNLFMFGEHQQEYKAHLYKNPAKDLCIDIFATEADAEKLSNFNFDERSWFESFDGKESLITDERLFYNKFIREYITLPDITFKASEVTAAIKAGLFDKAKLIFKK